MQSFDPTQPLIHIHVPKTAGSSLREVMFQWFEGRSYGHYFNAAEQKMPPRRDLAALSVDGMGPLIYGHFNRARGFGVDQYYPQVRQFTTILRDPLEMHVSAYFYIRKTPGHPQHQMVQRTSLRQFIQEQPLNMLAHFPRPVSAENYRDIIEEFFIDIGCQEALEDSMRRIGRKLGKPTDALSIPRLNTASRDNSEWQDMRDGFRERWPVEHAVYAYIRPTAPGELYTGLGTGS